MIYLDSSYVFKCYINEPGRQRVLSLVQNSSGCSSSLHARTEFGLVCIAAFAKR